VDSSVSFGDEIGIVSLALTVVGFGGTLIGILRVGSIAEAARTAAQSARLKLLAVDVLTAFDRVIAAVRDLMGLHRSKYSISLLHARYEATINAVLALEADLATEAVRYEQERRTVTALLAELSNLQETIEEYRIKKVVPDFTKANVTLGKLIMQLQARREVLRTQLGGNDGK
jgi:hypothetical protein